MTGRSPKQLVPHHRARLRGARRVGWAVALAAVLLGCSREPADATPDGAVRQFVERMRVFDGKSDEAEVLFEMLSERAKKNLRARAERYSAASGRTIAPSAMLVPSRMVLRFEPQSYQAQVVGKYAMVEVASVDPSLRASIPCVFEEGRWRVDLVLPELEPLRMGPGREP